MHDMFWENFSFYKHTFVLPKYLLHKETMGKKKKERNDGNFKKE